MQANQHSTQPVQKLAVIGAGTMGTGIAIVAARGGCKTFIVDHRAGLAERAIEALHDEIEQVSAQAEHDGLRFGIAESAIEFDHEWRARLIDHETRVKKSAVTDAVRSETAHRGQHDFAHHPLVHGCRDDGRRR